MITRWDLNELAHQEQDELMHYGVKGMRWGKHLPGVDVLNAAVAKARGLKNKIEGAVSSEYKDAKKMITKYGNKVVNTISGKYTQAEQFVKKYTKKAGAFLEVFGAGYLDGMNGTTKNRERVYKKYDKNLNPIKPSKSSKPDLAKGKKIIDQFNKDGYAYGKAWAIRNPSKANNKKEVNKMANSYGQKKVMATYGAPAYSKKFNSKMKKKYGITIVPKNQQR